MIGGTGVSFFRTDLFRMHGYVQNSGQEYTSSLFVELLRDYFSQDSYFHYVRDSFGFPETPKQNNLPYDAGINNDISTRLFIGEPHRQDVAFFPQIIVKNGGYRSVPIAMNRNKFCQIWEDVEYVDGYGNTKIIKRPIAYEQNGAWEGSIELEVGARSADAVRSLTDVLSLFFIDYAFERLFNSGVVVKALNASSINDGTIDRNEPLFKQTITIDVRTEWARRIPINNVIEIINFCIEFGDTYHEPFIPAPNLTINEQITLLEALENA